MATKALFILLLAFGTLKAAEYPWEKFENCTLVQERWKDGDSFHVKCGNNDLIFRLYFVDTPEDESRFPDRIAEQAAYFKVSNERSLKLGHLAAEFSTDALSAAPFTVYTLWQDAMGASKQPRYYAYIVTEKGPLCELLVKNGLARIYGKRIQLPDGMNSANYLNRLEGFEADAKREKVGGWAKAK